MTGQTPRILIVEDEPSIALSLRFLMEQEGYQVHVVEDGEAALEACRNVPPDLVLLDVMLPGMSGFEVCRQLKAGPDGQAIKVVLVTARGRETDLEKGRAVGADAYIVKPFAIREVMETVRTLLNRSGEAEQP
ncbi:response regulator transcription factor [Rhodothermus marinus]|uniref:Response regulator receiver protein n=1 Tax=Rhodothermus marinus (strain ATCC 43812 / DSM 4252 / R-10) TaxID=518766 RepID=D0MIT0_RHOM4|nr:response regulator [Rhodothermus marinus]ACY48388.1 response regulator receiver protein [Rhodothermus marinus DSM 4252]